MLLNEFKNSFMSRGVLGTLKWGYYGFLKVNNFIVFYRDISLPIDSRFLREDIEIRNVSLLDLKRIRINYDKLPFEFYCDETQGFQNCYVAFYEGRPAAIHWLVRPGEKSRFLNLEAGDVELNYNVVVPQFRGKRLAETLMAFIISDALKKGMKRIFGVVHVSNIPQYKPMLRLGFTPVECLTHFFVWRPKATLRYVK